MATRILSRSLLSASIPRSYFSSYVFTPSRLRPLTAAVSVTLSAALRPSATTRGFASRSTSSSLNDPNPNWSNRPPKETILLDGCDFEHWLVVLEKPEGDPTRDEIIDSYIKTLAMVVGSEEEARTKIYSVSTRHYFAFGALVSEELSYKIKELPKVRWVLPDSYLDVKNKDYGGEPFIDGQAVPYDPKYHEEWVRNNARAQDRNRRNDRPRNFDRSRNFERRRENMQNQDVHSRGPPPPNMSGSGPNLSPPGNFPPPNAPQNNAHVPQNFPQNNFPPQGNYPPQNNYPPRPFGNYPPQNNFAPQHNYPPQNNYAPGMNASPQNNSMPSQFNATRAPSRDFQHRDFSGNGPEGSPVTNAGNQNYGPGSGASGGRPY